MNCRRVSSLLSAYLDAELTGAEMLEVRAHLEACRACRAEHESLQQTKHLLASLALRAPRPEFESLLRTDLERSLAFPFALRWLPASWLLAWRDGAVGLSLPRPRPLMAAAALSLTTLFLASATVHSPSAKPDQEQSPRPALAPTPQLYPSYTSYTSYTFVPTVPLAQPPPLVWTGAQSSPLAPKTNKTYGGSSYLYRYGW